MKTRHPSSRFARRIKNLTVLLGLTVLCLALVGCATRRFALGVSGFSDGTYAGGRTYWLMSGNSNVATSDFEFREYAGYIRRGLSQENFVEATSFEFADLAIFVSYGIGDSKDQNFSYSLPVYGQTGGGTYTYSGTVSSRYGTSTTRGTAYQQPSYGVVGSQQFSGNYTTHLRRLVVEAIDLRVYRTENKSVSVWRTEVMSRGESGDLRLVFPVLVVAAAPHFGRNTGQQILMEIPESDERIQRMRAQPMP
jgi:hypothetical protein